MEKEEILEKLRDFVNSASTDELTCIWNKIFPEVEHIDVKTISNKSSSLISEVQGMILDEIVFYNTEDLYEIYNCFLEEKKD